MGDKLAEHGFPNMSAAVRPMALSPDERYVYFQLSFLHGFVEYDLQEDRPLRIANLPLSEEAQQLRREQYLLDSAHHGLAMNPSGTKLCAAGTMSDYAAIVSRKTFAYQLVQVGEKPYWSTNSGNGRYCFVSVSGNDRVSVIAYRTGREVAQHPGRRPPAAHADGTDPQGLRAVSPTCGRLLSRRSASSPGGILMSMRIAAFIAAGLLGLFSLGLVAGGALMLWGDAQKDDNGFISTDTERFATNTHAMTTDNLDVDVASVDWILDRDRWGKLRLDVEPRGGKPLFVGIARTSDVDRYLRGSDRDLVTDIDFSPFRADYRPLAGDAKPQRPAAQDFWVVSAHGAGPQDVTWEVEDGDWSIVVMNEDASPRVEAGVKAGADVPFLSGAGWGSVAAGLISLALAATLAIVGIRGPRRRNAVAA